MQEELGYLESGSQTLVRSLGARIDALGGCVHLRCATSEVNIENNRVTGVTAGGEFHPCDSPISTIPFPLVPYMIPGLPTVTKKQYRPTAQLGVVCIVHKLRRGVAINFWIDIKDERIEVPGIVQIFQLARCR